MCIHSVGTVNSVNGGRSLDGSRAVDGGRYPPALGKVMAINGDGTVEVELLSVSADGATGAMGAMDDDDAEAIYERLGLPSRRPSMRARQRARVPLSQVSLWTAGNHDHYNDITTNNKDTTTNSNNNNNNNNNNGDTNTNIPNNITNNSEEKSNVEQDVTQAGGGGVGGGEAPLPINPSSLSNKSSKKSSLDKLETWVVTQESSSPLNKAVSTKSSLRIRPNHSMVQRRQSGLGFGVGASASSYASLTTVPVITVNGLTDAFAKLYRDKTESTSDPEVMLRRMLIRQVFGNEAYARRYSSVIPNHRTLFNDPFNGSI